jgi:hypothetical protein
VKDLPRYSICLLPDELYGATLTVIALKLFENRAQNYLLTAEHLPYLPIVEFQAPNDQAAHALFNRWATRDRALPLEPRGLDITRETEFEDEKVLLVSRRVMMFFEPTEELVDLQMSFEAMAQKRPYKIILPQDDEDFPAIQLAEIDDRVFGDSHVRGHTAKLIGSMQTMTPALIRCDPQGHMIQLLAPTQTPKAN